MAQPSTTDASLPPRRIDASTTSRIEALLAPQLAGLGYEIVTCQWQPRSKTLRLSIDHLAERATALGLDPTRSGIKVEDCQAVSELANHVLDADAAFAGDDSYDLEVSSPGVERPLVRPYDFTRFAGQPVRIRLRRQATSHKQVMDAELVSADEEGAMLRLDTGPVRVAFADIERAHLRMAF